ncbi:MAG: acyl-CoA thioesterase [Spirochaetia bacterium]
MNQSNREIEMRDIVLPEATNPYGTLFGGKLLEMIDKAAGICAAKFACSRVVTASLEAVDFLIPIFEGQVINIKAKIIYAGKSSMVIAVRVIAEDVITQSSNLCCTAHVNMVAVDGKGKPVEVPEYEPMTKTEAHEYEEGKTIRNQALARIGEPLEK